MFQRFLRRLDVGVYLPGSPSSPQTYSKPQKAEALLPCVHHTGLFLIEGEAQILENRLEPLQNPIGIAFAQYHTIIGIPYKPCLD